MDCTDERVRASAHATGVTAPPTRPAFRTRAAALFGVLCPVWAFAQEPEIQEDLRAAYGSADVISLATGYERALFDAPVSATILSREDIRRSGAHSLADVLQMVPGYYVTSNDARSTQITVRGITSRVLILVNNLPLYQGFVNATQTLHDLLLYDVERIEITRGPGSAVYGADAMAGIVNIITRTASAGPLAEVAAMAGNHESIGAYGLYGTGLRDLNLRLYGAYYETEFTDRVLASDAQTNFDRLLGTSASLAPDLINAARKIGEARASLSGNTWAVRASHRNEFDFGTGTGLTFALDPQGTYDSRVSTLEFVHQSTPSDSWSLRGYLAGTRIDQIAQDVHPFPPGAFRGAFPQGVRQDFDINETRYRAEGSATYIGIARHILLVTAGGFISEYETEHDVRNYVVRGGLVLPTPTFAEGAGVNDPEIIGDADRNVWYVVLQDEWAPVRDWTLTLGVRFDDYSDFGSTANPRAAVVWSPSPRTSLKLLFGTAFRPPSIVELESNGTFSALGNPNLDPSRLAMTEISLTHRRERYSANIGAFAYRQKDLVETTPNPAAPTGIQYVNGDDDEGWGLDLSLTGALRTGYSVEGHYTYQTHTGSTADNDNAQQAPHHQLSAAVDYAFADRWHANATVLGIFDRGRASTDPRPDPPDYALMNVMLERTGLPGSIDLSLSVRNLFDRQIDDPSDSPTVLAADVPVPGRSWLAQLRKRF